jgi:alpha-L-rhamnosidase/Glycosyl hydrolases family 2, sugar binding domain
MRFFDSRWRHLSAAACISLIGVWAVLGQTQGDPLLSGFQNPPDSAKPRVWWHWMSGNVTKEGIKLDFEWFKRVGIAGFHNFDAGLNSPQIVEKRLVYMTPEWKDAFKYATTLADQMGLEMTIASSPGWSESGGPWVPPAQAMKKYVWSETRVEGGRPFTGALPKPPSTTGTYQNQGGGRGRGGGQEPPEFYADAAVVAYRAPDNDRTMSEMQAKVSSSGGVFGVAALTDGDVANGTLLPAAPVGQRAWIQYEFPQAQTFGGLTFITAGGGGGRGGFPGGRGGGPSIQQLEASDDGTQFHVVAPIGAGRTITFPATTARFFRISILTPEPGAQQPGRGGSPPAGAPAGGGGQGGRGQGQGPAAPAGTQIAEFVLHSAVVNRFQEKAAFQSATNIYDMATPSVPAPDVVHKVDVVDLTSKMRPDGTLDWTPPAGRWVVVRLGYSLTGHQNSPASPEATGLEVDKLNPTFTRAYFTNYLDQYKDATGGLMGNRGLKYVLTDSWEAGVANWTNDMFAEFSKRRGYDMKPWLPALTGNVVESAEATDRFLWDFRKTLSEMVVEYHYDMLTQIVKERGMMGRYSESHESGRALIADGMDVKRSATIPMSATWTNGPGRAQTRYDADVLESASVAHIYGQNLVAAESMTASQGVGSSWAFSPETLKPTADRELSNGLNRFVIHCSVHQSTDDKIPGLSLGPFGQWFNRHETWAEYAKPWMTYLARSSYMLQQGKFSADIAYYYGEDSNITAMFAANARPVPPGHGFDFINSDAILKQLSASPTGTLTTPSGMSYRVLALDPNSQHMPLAVLRKIRDLVNAGAVVVGPKPIDSPSLADDQAQFKTIADQLWGGTTNKGKVFGTGTIDDALNSLKLAADFLYTKPQQDTELAFVHRKLTDGDFYWVSHRNATTEDLEASFRTTGKAPELWHADTGVVENASYRTENGRTIVPLHLGPNDAVFVVFRKAAATPLRSIAKPTETKLTTVDGSWDVAFQPNRGAPASATLPALTSWHENSDPGVKYFSGTGTYRKTIQVPADWFQTGAKLILDLGDVKNVADVTVNGKELGTIVLPPFSVDVTSALKPGANQLEIKVTNLWVNRLIGDQQPNVTQKITWTASSPYRADSPLVPSGLIGPVQVLRSANK